MNSKHKDMSKKKKKKEEAQRTPTMSSLEIALYFIQFHADVRNSGDTVTFLR